MPDSEHRDRVADSWCPRCGSDLIPPGLFDSSWRCGKHGQVPPLSIRAHVDEDLLDQVRGKSEVPVWLIDPAPVAWQLCGLALVGDPRGRINATAASYRGPAPLGGEGEWLIVAEEPGIGLGAAYAQSAATVGSAQLAAVSPSKIQTSGRPTPLWVAPDAASHLSAYVGEAAGVWIWLISFPSDAGYALLENLSLSDARDLRGVGFELGSVSTRLRPTTASSA
jgi:hypothetical protein